MKCLMVYRWFSKQWSINTRVLTVVNLGLFSSAIPFSEKSFSFYFSTFAIFAFSFLLFPFFLYLLTFSFLTH